MWRLYPINQSAVKFLYGGGVKGMSKLDRVLLSLARRGTKTPVSRVAGGHYAKLAGKRFENFLEHRFVELGWQYVHLPQSGARWVGKNRIISQSIICDFIVGAGGKTMLIDAKSISSKRYSYSKIKQNISHIKEMHRFISGGGCFDGGFIVFYEKIDQLKFYNTEKLLSVKKGNSLTLGEGKGLANLL